MYNMDISILGYKLNLEVLILIGVVYLIMVGHTVCGCCNVSGIMEGLTNMATDKITNVVNDIKKGTDKIKGTSTTSNTMLPTQVTPNNNFGSTVKSEVNSAINNKMGGTTEGFVGANTNYGESSRYSLTQDNVVNTSSWDAPNLVVVPGQPLSPGVKEFLNRPAQPVPLPQGEMLMFANTPFKPECCPNTYSTGSGCACMTGDQYNYLILRGGNNVPYSEY